VEPWTPMPVGTRAFWWPIAQPRGSRWEPPPFVPPPAPSPWTVEDVGTRSLWALPKPRGSRWDPVWPFIAPAPPAFTSPQLGRHRPLGMQPRRGRFFAVPPTPPGRPPLFVCARHRGPAIRPRRGRYSEPPWPTAAPVQPSTWLPGPVAARRRPPTVRRRSRFFEPAWPFVPPTAMPARSTVTEHTGILTTPDVSTVTTPQASTRTTPATSRLRTRNRSEVDLP